MSLDGLRAWIGEVERKLGMRTRVFLALAVVAIGLGGAAIYLALDARSDAVSEGDVRELQEQLEAQIAEGGATGADADAVAQLESQVEVLQTEVEQLREGESDDSKGASGTNGDNGGKSDAGNSGTGASNPEKAKEQFQELLDQAEGQGSTGK